MSYLLVGLIALNVTGFVCVVAWALWHSRTVRFAHGRMLYIALAAVFGALASGGLLRLQIQLARAGWYPSPPDVLDAWSTIQLPLAFLVGGVMLCALRKAAPALAGSESYVRAQASRVQQASEQVASLTAREREVLAWLASGVSSDGALAERLDISPATCATHVRNMLRKTGVRSREDLAVLGHVADIASPTS